MPESITPKATATEKHAAGLPVSEPAPAPIMSSAGQAQDATPQGKTTASRFKSFWGKAKEALAKISAQAPVAGGSLTSEAVTLGTTAAAKTAELGKQTLSVSVEATRDAIEISRQAYSGSRIESAVEYLDSELEQRGVKQALKETSAAVAGKVDEVIGKRLLELVEQRLQMQDLYNDVLATRLAEALERISRLETQLAEIKTGPAEPAQGPGTEGAHTARRHA